MMYSTGGTTSFSLLWVSADAKWVSIFSLPGGPTQRRNMYTSWCFVVVRVTPVLSGYVAVGRLRSPCF